MQWRRSFPELSAFHVSPNTARPALVIGLDVLNKSQCEIRKQVSETSSGLFLHGFDRVLTFLSSSFKWGRFIEHGLLAAQPDCMSWRLATTRLFVSPASIAAIYFPHIISSGDSSTIILSAFILKRCLRLSRKAKKIQ